MNDRAYYNEIDPAACAVLRELIACGLIPPGDVDDRSIKDVQPSDLAGYVQCHFFAGMGGWPFAARLAGRPDDWRWWSASCPCQGESVAGKKLGADDPRHLWPDLYRLIRACRPSIIVGEQVARAAGTHWLDRVCSDLDDADYASRAVDLTAQAVDAPHQRQRIYWLAMADADSGGRDRRQEDAIGRAQQRDAAERVDRELEHAAGERRRKGWPEHEVRRRRDAAPDADARCGSNGDVDDSRRVRQFEPRELLRTGRLASHDANGVDLVDANRQRFEEQRRPFAVRTQQPSAQRPNGSFYSDAEWIVCADGKARRAKPGVRMLVDGLAGRTDLWRMAGNGLVLGLAAEVIAAIE